MTPEIPQRLVEAGWTGTQKLGSGGQSRVYQIKGPEGVRALKILQEKASAAARDRFIREVNVLQEIDHPNIVKIIESDTEAELPWYSMKVHRDFSGWWKTARIKESPNALVAKSVGIIRALADALSVLHAKNYIHRDIKDKNILMSKEGPVLCDFGLVFRRQGHRLSAKDPIKKKQSQIIHRYEDGYEYQPTDDCFDLVAFWSWMLARRNGLQFDYYHWRHFQLIKAAAVDKVRAIWAACSDDRLAPKSGEDLCRLIDSIFPEKLQDEETAPLDFREQARRAAAANAKSMMKTAERLEVVRAFLQSYDPFLKTFIDGLNDIHCKLVEQMGEFLESSFATPSEEIAEYFRLEMERLGSKINERKNLAREAIFLRTDLSRLDCSLSLTIHIRFEWSGSVCNLKVHKSGAFYVLENGENKRVGNFNQMFISAGPGLLELDPDRERQVPANADVASFDDLLADISNLVKEHVLPENLEETIARLKL